MLGGQPPALKIRHYQVIGIDIIAENLATYQHSWKSLGNIKLMGM